MPSDPAPHAREVPLANLKMGCYELHGAPCIIIDPKCLGMNLNDCMKVIASAVNERPSLQAKLKAADALAEKMAKLLDEIGHQITTASETKHVAMKTWIPISPIASRASEAAAALAAYRQDREP